MSDIGPGGWVQAIRGVYLTAGALYQVEEVAAAERGGCMACGGRHDFGFLLVGVPLVTSHQEGWAPCNFRKWPGETDEALRSERSPYHEQEPTHEPV